MFLAKPPRQKWVDVMEIFVYTSTQALHEMIVPSVGGRISELSKILPPRKCDRQHLISIALDRRPGVHIHDHERDRNSERKYNEDKTSSADAEIIAFVISRSYR